MKFYILFVYLFFFIQSIIVDNDGEEKIKQPMIEVQMPQDSNMISNIMNDHLKNSMVMDSVRPIYPGQKINYNAVQNPQPFKQKMQDIEETLPKKTAEQSYKYQEDIAQQVRELRAKIANQNPFVREIDINKCNIGWNYHLHGRDWECMYIALKINLFIQQCKTGKLQSPINIPLQKEKLIPLKTNILFQFPNNKNRGVGRWVNNGATISLETYLGNLILPPFNYVYKANEMHFHLDAEHRIGGESFPLELRIQYKIANEKNINKWVNPYVSVCILFQEGDEKTKPHPFLNQLNIEHLPKEYRETKYFDKLLNFELLFKGNKYKKNHVYEDEHTHYNYNQKNYEQDFPLSSFFQYDGSVTTPSCEESVTYIIREDIAVATREQLETLRLIIKQELMTQDGNFREIQSKNGRPVYYFDNSFAEHVLKPPCDEQKDYNMLKAKIQPKKFSQKEIKSVDQTYYKPNYQQVLLAQGEYDFYQ